MRPIIALIVCSLFLPSCETLSDGVGLPIEMPFKSPAKKKALAEEAAQKAAEQARAEAAAEAKKKAAALKKKAQVAAKKRSLATYTGIASWYSVKTNGGTKTASGRTFTNNGYTAAHKTLPFGSKVRVTSLYNGRSEVLTITDRGPYIKGRIIDVSIGCAKRMGWYGRGVTKVKVEVLSRGNWKYKH